MSSARYNFIAFQVFCYRHVLTLPVFNHHMRITLFYAGSC